jgi:hypothetical protein
MKRAGEFDIGTRQPDGTPPGGASLYDHVRRLVPASGIQFLDSRIDATRLPMLRTWFVEDEFDAPTGPRRVLLPLASDQTIDGTIWHPVTFKALGPSETLSFTGLEGIEPFLDHWIPVPFLRYLGRGDNGPRFDAGPANWARVYVAAPAGGLRSADELDVVFAFDTRLDTASRADQSTYLAPNTDDALFASTFMLAEGAEQLGDFLNQPWLDAWVRERCTATPGATPWGTGEDSAFADARLAVAPDFKLRHVAHYLTFLKILNSCANPPQIRFVDSISTSLPIGRTGIDLVIDFHETKTTAVLLSRTDQFGPDIVDASRKAVPLRLRDLTRPVIRHSGDIATVVEFDHQTFGSASHSRRSGRPDAFAWSSLVRVGSEAQRLALRANAIDGVTGLSDLAGRLSNTAMSDIIWRFSTTDGPTPKTSPMVTGETMRHLTEGGDVLNRIALAAPINSTPSSEPQSVGAVRPRFSQSSLVGFFAAEVLLHAISEINSAAPDNPFAQNRTDGNAIRQLDRVIITSSLAMPANERQMLAERMTSAIDLVWQSQGWDRPSPLAQPPKPKLTLGLGSDVGLQLVYLLDEVRTKLGGTFSDLVESVRRRSGDPDARDSLRISSIDLSRRTSGLTVIDYDVVHDGSVRAQLVLADRISVGGDAIIDALVIKAIVPAIERGLIQAGSPDAAELFASAFSTLNTNDASDQLVLDKRLTTKVFVPAARALFELYTRLPPRGTDGLRTFTIDRLVTAGGGRLDPVSDEFDAACASAGADNFRLASVALQFSRRLLQALFETELGPTLNALTAAIDLTNCDLVLIGGELAHVADLRDAIIGKAPVPAGRIVVMGANSAQPPQPGRSNQPAAAPAPGHPPIRLQSLLGAYLAGRDLLRTDQFDLITTDISAHLSRDAANGSNGMLYGDDEPTASTSGPAKQSTRRPRTPRKTANARAAVVASDLEPMDDVEHVLRAVEPTSGERPR